MKDELNPFTNREIIAMFKEIKDTLVRVETQVTKTNGRVTLLEYWKEGLTGKIVGGMAVLSLLWSVIMRNL